MTVRSGRRLRLAFAGLSHETNTFAVQPADLAWFTDAGILRGDQIVAEYATSSADVAGFLAAAEAFDVDVVPLLYTFAPPCGTITSDAFETIVGEIVQLIRDGGPWDGVLLAQHGAAVSEAYPDADGEVVRRVREAMGPTVAIGQTHDMHANVSPQMVANSTVTTIYRTNPHLDAKERALECAGLILRTIRGEIHPTQVLVQIPAAIEIVRQDTKESPMREICADLETVLQRPGILSASVAEGYPWADVEEMGMAFLTVADGDTATARDAAHWMAERAWARRHEFVGHAPTADEALAGADRELAAGAAMPIVLMDVGDNIGGGGTADSTVLLEAAQRLGIRGFGAILFDPAAVAACESAGVGGRVALEVGGHLDNRYLGPVRVTGQVRSLTDGVFEDPLPTHGGIRFFDAGRTAVLDTTDGHTLLLTARVSMPLSPVQWTAAGVDPVAFRIIAAKGVVSPQPGYRRVASKIVLVDTPGVTANDLRLFDYRHRRRPLIPLERDATFPG